MHRGDNVSIDDVFASIDAARSELEGSPTFASDHAGAISPVSRQLAAELAQGHDQYDQHIAHASRTMHHDQRPFEDKANAVPHDPGNGNGSGWPGPGQPPPWWPPTKGSGGGSGGGTGNGSGGPPSWFKKWWQQQRQRGGMQRGGGGARGLGGGGLAGPGSIGNVPQLGKVPIAPAGATSGGGSPVVIILIVASLGIGGYLLWHKLKLAKHQDAQIAAGRKPDADNAT
jgi:hypothetical protein